jgi:oligopeptide transport system permease protein
MPGMHSAAEGTDSLRGTITKRLVDGLLVLLLTHAAVFIALRLLPGDPFADIAGEKTLPAEAIARLQQLYGHDGSIAVQYLRELAARITGDFGLSLKIARGVPVTSLLASALPVSVAIGCGALLVGILLGGCAGVLAARSATRPGSRFIADRVVRWGSSVGVSLPDFVLGTGLLLLALLLGGLPAGGLDHPSGLVLPVLTLGLPMAAAIARLTRASLLDELRLDFVRTAVAKGAGPLRQLGHALRPAAAPVTAYIAQAAAAVLTGSLVVETLFSLPGLGHAFVAGALTQDWTVVSGAALLYTALLVLLNLTADLIGAWLDPRMR